LVVDTGKVIAQDPSASVIKDGLGAVPVAGNILSGIATINDVWGKEGLINYYHECMAGEN
jgi:hypothetical protein